MYRPGPVPAPMPKTGGRKCGSPEAGRHAAQSATIEGNRGRAARPRPQTPAPGPGPGKRDYTVLAPLRSRSGDNRFPEPDGHRRNRAWHGWPDIGPGQGRLSRPATW
jgi:hypothetical protein